MFLALNIVISLLDIIIYYVLFIYVIRTMKNEKQKINFVYDTRNTDITMINEANEMIYG